MMKFIPGKKFLNNTRKNTRLFEKNKIYTLQNIKPNGKYIEYSFMVNNEVKMVNFQSVQEADDFLETIIY